MKKRFIFLFLFLFLINIPTYSDFKKDLEEFEGYKKQIDDEFSRYKEIVSREFELFKREIYKEWGDYLLPDKVRWVEYSQDLKKRTIVDFEKNRIIIQFKPSPNENERSIIREQLKKVVDETVSDAFNNTKPLVNIEKKTKDELNVSPSPNMSKMKVVGDLLGNRVNVDQMTEQGEVRTTTNKNGEKVSTFTIQLKISDREKALKFKGIVDAYSKKYNLEPSLVYAIIHTESYFNPMATSPAPAYGLMQIMPSNAGKDAARVLFGSPLILLPSFLYNPENNVNVGTTYFNLLKEEYTKEIKDEKSRFYIAIVGYNVGLRNVYRVFSPDGNPKNAFNEINRLSSDEVYAKITKNLPQRGGVDYLLKIMERMKFYSDL